MIQIFTILFCTFLMAFVITVMFTYCTISTAVVIATLIIIVLLFWACFILSVIIEEVRTQAEDLRDFDDQEVIRDAAVEAFAKDKKAYEASLERYKNEVQVSLLDTYRQFEEALMDKVRDSKLVATIIKRSGYADVIMNHHAHIVMLSEQIRACDHGIHIAKKNCETNKINFAKKILVRQGRGIFGYHYLFPKHLVFEETDSI